MYSVDNYMERLYKARAPAFNIDAVADAQGLSDFQGRMRGGYIACLGGMPQGRPLEAAVLSEVQRDGFKRIKIEYTLDENLRAPAYILVPDGAGAQTPAVVALHGHGYGVADMVGLTEDGQEKSGGYHKYFAVELAKRGFIVAAPELFGFGELMLAPNGRHPNNGAGNSCFMLSTQMLLYGRTMAGMRVWQGVRMLDYLAGRGAGRIGAMGISGGGLACSFLAAYDKRVQACVVSGYFCTYKASIMSVYHCVDNFPPGILALGEMADLFGLIAPRPMLIEAGLRDDIFPADGVRESYARLERLYGRVGAGGRLELDMFDGGHQISGARAYDFLKQWL